MQEQPKTDKPKATYQEFAAKIKSKYPQYKDVDDYELAQRIVEKYPQYEGQVDLKKKDWSKQFPTGQEASSRMSSGSSSQSVPAEAAPVSDYKWDDKKKEALKISRQKALGVTPDLTAEEKRAAEEARVKTLVDFYDESVGKYGDEALQSDPRLTDELQKDWAIKNGNVENLFYNKQKASSEATDKYELQKAQERAVVPTEKIVRTDEQRKKLAEGRQKALGQSPTGANFGMVDTPKPETTEEDKAAIEKIPTETGFKIKEDAIQFKNSVLTAKANSIINNPETVKKIDELNSVYNSLESMSVDENSSDEAIAAYNESVKQYNTLLQDDDIRTVNGIYKQFDLLTKEAEEVIKNNKDIAADRLDKKAKQETIDLLFSVGAPNFNTQNAVIGQLGRSATKLAADILRLPSLFDGDNKYGAIDKWNDAVGAVSDHINDSLFPEPTMKSLFYDDEKGKHFRGELLLPKTAKLVGDMAALFYGAGKISTGLKAAGLGTKASEAVGLFSSSYAQTFNDYKTEGIAAGLNPDEAFLFAHSASTGQAALELISPQKYLWANSPKGIAESFVKNVRAGMSKKEAIKQSGLYTLKQIGGENLQEFSQNISDVAARSAANALVEREALVNDDFTNLSLETLVLTSIVSGAPAAVASGLNAATKDARYDEAVRIIASEKEKYMPMLQQAFKEQDVDAKYVEKVLKDIQGVDTEGVDNIETKTATETKTQEAVAEAAPINEVTVKESVAQGLTTTEGGVNILTGASVVKLTTDDHVDQFTKAQTTETGQRLGKVLGAARKVLSKIVPNVKIAIYNGDKEGANIQTKLGIKETAAYGFYDSKGETIYINGGDFKTDTPFHEAIHPIVNALKQSDPARFQRFAKEAGVNKVDLADGTTTDYLSLNDGNHEEALVEMLGDFVDGKFDEVPSTYEKIRQVIVSALEAMGIDPAAFGMDSMSSSDLKGVANTLSRAFNQGKAVKVEGKKADGVQLQEKKPLSKVNNSTTTQEFFSNTVKGANQPIAPWKPIKKFTEKVNKAYSVWENFRGGFDSHIETNIPAFRDVQVKKINAISEYLPKGGLVIDLGGSEGGFGKSITSLNPSIKTVNLDMNPDMRDAHEKSPVKGADFELAAFGEDVPLDDGTVVKRHQPKNKADVVHESMMFQFITPERDGFVNEVAEHYIKPDGVFIVEEKVIAENWDKNESKKDKDFKSQYYESQAIKDKQEKVVAGMKGNQASEDSLLAALLDKFDYVYQYWDSGNFKGYLASNSRENARKMLSSIGDTSTEYTSRKELMEVEAGSLSSEIIKIKALPKEKEGGVTLNLDGTTYNGDGLIVPIVSNNYELSSLTRKDVENFIKENKSKTGGETVKVGLYKFPNSNNASIDLNIVVPSKHRAAALEFGKLANQESLFDLGSGENIKTGADGKNPTKFTDEQFKQIEASLSKGEVPSFIKAQFSPKRVADKVVDNKGVITDDGKVVGVSISIPDNIDKSTSSISFSTKRRIPKMSANISRGDLSDYKGKKMTIIPSDRLSTGIIENPMSGKNYTKFGGIFYNPATGNVWASSSKSAANKIVNSLDFDENGEAHIGIMTMANDSHMSNINSFTYAIDAIEDAVKKKRVTAKFALERINKAIETKGVSNSLQNKNFRAKGNFTSAIASLRDFFSNENSTFGARKPFLESLLGNSKVKDSLWGGIPTFNKVSELLTEPTLKGVPSGHVVAVMTVKSKPSVEETSNGDKDFHESYPFVIKADESKFTLLNNSYDVTDVAPELRMKSGDVLKFSDYIDAYGQDKGNRAYVRQINLSPKTEEVRDSPKKGDLKYKVGTNDEVLHSKKRKVDKKLNRTAKRIANDEDTRYVKVQLDVLSNPEKYKYTPQDITGEKVALSKLTDQEVVERTKTIDRLIRNITGDNAFAILSAIEAINRLEAAGLDSTHVFEKLREAGTSIGQLLRQFGELKTGTAAGLISVITKNLESLNQSLTEKQSGELTEIAKEYIDSKTKAEDARLNFIESPSDKNDSDLQEAIKVRDDAFRGLVDWAAINLPPSLNSILTTTMKGNLFVPVSLVANVVGNTIQYPAGQLELLAGDIGGYIAHRNNKNPFHPINTFFGATFHGMGGFLGSIYPSIKQAIKGDIGIVKDKFEIRNGLHPMTAWGHLLAPLTKALGVKKYSKYWDALPVNSGGWRKGKVPVGTYVSKVIEGTTGINAEVMFRGLFLGDNIFREGAKAAALYRVYANNGGSNKYGSFERFLKETGQDSRVKNIADEAASDATFASDRTLSTISGEGLKFVNKAIDTVADKVGNNIVGDAVRIIGNLIKTANFPFVKIPANLVQHAIELTFPILAIGAGMGYVGKGVTSGRLKGANNPDITKGMGLIARGGMGFAFLYFADMMIEAGAVVAGAADDDPDKRGRKRDFAGGPNTINISLIQRVALGIHDTENPYQEGDDYIEFAKLGTFGIAFMTRAHMRESVKEDNKDWNELGYGEKGLAYISGLLGSVVELSFLQGTKNLMDATKKDGFVDASAEFMNTISSIAIPNNAAVVTKARREYVLSNKDEDAFTALWEKQKTKLFPNAEDMTGVYPYTDMWGQPAIQNKEEGAYGKINPYLKSFFDITKGGKITDPLSAEMWNLEYRTKEGVITEPAGSASLPDFQNDQMVSNVKMTERDIMHLKMIAGQLKRMAIQDNKAEYDALTTDSERVAFIKKVNNLTNSAARKFMVGKISEALESGDAVLDVDGKKYRYLEPEKFDKKDLLKFQSEAEEMIHPK